MNAVRLPGDQPSRSRKTAAENPKEPTMKKLILALAALASIAAAPAMAASTANIDTVEWCNDYRGH